MEHENTHRRFNGAAWFDQQVRRRTREALNARGSNASTHSAVYRAEYARQLELFRRERTAVKQHRAEKYAQRLSRQTEAQRGA